jgi:rRNA-processing protein FCF1
MNNIIIDTNIIYLDFKLRNARIVSLCDTADILGHKVYIPEVVIDEARPSGFIIRRL